MGVGMFSSAAVSTGRGGSGAGRDVPVIRSRASGYRTCWDIVQAVKGRNQGTRVSRALSAWVCMFRDARLKTKVV